MISPTFSVYLLNRLAFSRSMIREARFCRSDSTARRPKSASLISSATSSPTSYVESILRASVSEICWFGFTTVPSSTIVRLRHISRSPFSGLMITSKFSSVS